jgi:hypothetical protein
LLYFAYGSNLHPRRLSARAPAARLVSAATLPRFQLRFHKRGGDGSGKCDCVPGGETHVVHGAVYELSPECLDRLDAAEGPGYRKCPVRVKTRFGALEAFTYRARPDWITPTLLPFRWYRQLVLAGVRFHGFPAGYRRVIEAVPAREDPDAERAAEHAALLEAIRRTPCA